ncbi:metallophosphoesterase [Listeria booriae]|nr:metallophosphoesterase [Listeria booriae]
MKITIINFSDVHFKEDNNSVEEKRGKVINAIQSRIHLSDRVICVINGDSAFSGKKEEFDRAYMFFTSIAEKLNSTNVDFLCVPGNHDCDFDAMDSYVRNIMLEKCKATNDEIAIDKVLAVQEQFNKYNDNFISKWKFSNLIHDTPLYRMVDYNLDEELRLRFHLFNTAWCSTLNEAPGTMYMPVELIRDAVYDECASLNISVLHHPTHWLEPNNKRQFDQMLDQISDIVFWGHEHADDIINQNKTSGNTAIIEGSVLQENFDQDISSFNIFNIDIKRTDEKEQKVVPIQFEWNSTNKMYTEKNSNELILQTAIRREVQLDDGTSKSFLLSDEMSDYILDIGAPINHPMRNTNLADIYVYPDLKVQMEGKESKRDLEAEDFINELSTKNGIWFIEGEKETGKTALLKQLYKRFGMTQNIIIPIRLDAADIKEKKSLDRLDKLIEKEFNNQYRGDSYESFVQLDINRRAILIDDWNFCKLNKKGKKELLHLLTKKYGKIIIFAENNPTNITDLLGMQDELEHPINLLEIRKFGYKKREELIDKWIRIGHEYDYDESDIVINVDQYSK